MLQYAFVRKGQNTQKFCKMSCLDAHAEKISGHPGSLISVHFSRKICSRLSTFKFFPTFPDFLVHFCLSAGKVWNFLYSVILSFHPSGFSLGNAKVNWIWHVVHFLKVKGNFQKYPSDLISPEFWNDTQNDNFSFTFPKETSINKTQKQGIFVRKNLAGWKICH